VTKPALTPAQLREARELLHWSREKLAMRLDVSFQTIGRFERGLRVSSAFDTRQARKILEAAGIEFFEDNDGAAAVRLMKGLT
jgi:transcriptional regulator with XRE-family HTH domain